MWRNWSNSKKAGIAIMALWEEKTAIEIVPEVGALPNMISKWKRELLDK